VITTIPDIIKGLNTILYSDLNSNKPRQLVFASVGKHVING